MRIEILSGEDWERLRDLRLRVLQDSPEWFAAIHAIESQRIETEWREEAKKSHWRVITNGEDIGLMAVSAAEPIRECDCWLSSCWIDPKYRGQGLMKMIIDELDAICESEGWVTQGLGVWPHNLRAIKSYEKYGFEKVGEPKQSRSRPDQLFQPMFRHRQNTK